MKMVCLTPKYPAKTTSTNLGNLAKPIPGFYMLSHRRRRRTAKNVGFDGLDNVGGSYKISEQILPIQLKMSQTPAADDFVFYLSNQFQGHWLHL